MERRMTLRQALMLTAILAGLVLTVAIGVATYAGYKWFTDRHTVSTDGDGVAAARVVAATMYARSDLRVSKLSGTVQGTARASRLWGWLNSTQVVKAPFTVDYFVDLARLAPGDFAMRDGGRTIVVTIPDVVPASPNIDMAQASLNEVKGVFVSRGAMVEMAPKVVGSAQRVVAQGAASPENMAKARENGRVAVARLFGGAMRAARVDARIEVRFAGERDRSSAQWDVSRSVAEVLADAARR